MITEGEFDAMAVHQQTGFPSVSLPNGASHFPKQLLPFFDQFEHIYLWLDSDDIGIRQAEKFAEILGPNRTIIIDLTWKEDHQTEHLPKDANDCLR